MGNQSTYPGQFDTDVELPRVDDNITEIGSEAINSIRDAIFSIEQSIGLDPQGNLQDFVTRINRVIDDNGVIKTDALAEKGLVTLPIANIHVGSTAAIQESKLDLDYGTSLLNGKIVANVTDIESLRTSFNALVSRTLLHFTGLGDRHDGYHISLVNSIRSSDDLETALNVLNNAFGAHETSYSSAHPASAISVINEFNNFSADNVQSALIELDELGAGRVEKHQDLLHTNSVSLNEAGVQSKQGNISSTAFASTIYQTEVSKATNILQVMRPNVARVTGKIIDFGELVAGVSQTLRVQVGGIGRSWMDIDLSAIIPTYDINDIVEAINQTAQGCVYHYPISAYNTGGKLTIAHNIPGEEFTIQILDDVQFSAASALGFGDVTSVEFVWAGDNHAGYVGGERIEDAKSFIKVHHVHTNRPLRTITPGLGDLTEYGISVGNEGRILCNITNHSTTPDDNGTHYITAFPNNETFTLSADIQNGTFDLEIPADAVNFENSANGEIYDIFVEADRDGYGILTKQHHISYGTITGVDLVAVNNDFPTSGVSWQIVDSSQIQLFKDGLGGVPVSISTGFVGTLEVFAPDNINSALFEVTGAPGNATRDITVSEFAKNNDRFHVASVHYSGNHGIYKLKYVTDKRKLGGSVESTSEDVLEKPFIETALNDLRNNGVIRGLDVMSSDSSNIRVRGGKALVGGKIIEVETQYVGVNDFSATKKALLLDRNGNFVVKSEFDSGYAFSDLISGDAYGDNRGVVTIAEFETDGSSIDGYILDRRFIIANIDKKLLDTETMLDQKITQVQNTVQGSMWGFVVASVSGTDDGYLASIEPGANNGFSYIPSGVGWWDEYPNDAHGFLGGRTAITTRRFEFSNPSAVAPSVFRSPGLTHLNVFVEVIYTGRNGGPFGVSGGVSIDFGVSVELGLTSITTYEEYARIKNLTTGVLPASVVTERYVVSIPTSKLNLADNVIFDIVPRARIIGSNLVDGGTGSDAEPVMKFDHIRIITSSYSIAGQINEEDGSDTALSALIGEIL